MSTQVEQIIAELQATLPPVLAGKSLDELTAHSINWRTTQNARSRGEIPAECFAYAGRKVLILRDPFLAWWRTTLRPAVGRKHEVRGDE